MRIGSLFSGYGGLDMAVSSVTGATTAWVSDIDKGANKILAHRYPDVPNLGDISTVDWTQVEPVDILTGGYPCQPFSLSGDRKGTADERHLWPFVREAVRHLRPRLTVLENVAGHRSMGFDRVLGDLAEDGLNAQWTSVLASDAGAPHRRERLFILVTDPAGLGSESPWPSLAISRRPDRARGTGERALLPTPRVSDTNGAGAHGDGGLDLRTAVAHLPTPRATRGGSSTETVALLPTPKASDGEWGLPRTSGRPPEMATHLATRIEFTDFGIYAAAIGRWERVTGRPAPSPTDPSGKGGRPQLAPRFTEWLMGLPAGWITDVPGITRSEALKACGNGVVPQQAIAALRVLLNISEAAA